MEILFIQIRGFLDTNLNSHHLLMMYLTIAEKFLFKLTMRSQKYVVLAKRKGAVATFSNLSSVELRIESIQILGCHHSYNKQLAENRFFGCDF